MNDNSKILLKQLGWNSNNEYFLDGVMFAPSFVQKTIPHFQKTYMADACHLNFGKCTLFSCYGVTANSNMSPVGFAIIFGNKNTSNLTKFWEYVLKLHPSMNSGYITIITNQNKGQKIEIARSFNEWVTSIVGIAVRILLRGAEEAAVRHSTLLFGCTTSSCIVVTQLRLNTQDQCLLSICLQRTFNT